MTTPYIYKLTFKPSNKIYIGSRTRVKCNPNEFWVNYFTSSNTIKSMVTEHGTSSDIWEFEILETFSNTYDRKLVVKREHELIEQSATILGCANLLNNVFFKYGEAVFTVAGRKRPKSECDAISKAQTGRIRTPDQIEKHRLRMTGRKLSDEHKRKVSESLMGHSVHKNTIEALSKRQKKWNNCSATQTSNDRWKRAQEFHDAWVKTGYGYARLGKLFNEGKTTLQTIVNMFKSGWVPKDDPEWVTSVGYR